MSLGSVCAAFVTRVVQSRRCRGEDARLLSGYKAVDGFASILNIMQRRVYLVAKAVVEGKCIGYLPVILGKKVVQERISLNRCSTALRVTGWGSSENQYYD